ncbi:DUF4302 domain-containing protein [Pedobacter gandavensis]|uniref:DUF4302 domain-containing protein n=1 Tax=Pedobacter gandavensis TaxID=2679963 RepID=UPI002478C06E|nr:DUF4302 domain-containing protein [Pedobacter gandavensis]WGQ07836.1 DUF4302 domain-containing protein [Pedobacter gandavensis]
MKRFLLYIVLLSAGFITGCKKDENPILDDPDQRVAAALVEHQAQLLSAENGWKATIYPKLGKGFSFYFKFDKEGKVKMLSDFNTTTAVTFQESTYRLKALQFPTLMFDTYNYIHLPADPNGSISGGTNGKGLTSDFEFAFDGMSGDTLKMRGIANGNLMDMVKVTAAEATAYGTEGIKNMMDANTAFQAVNKFPYLVSGSTKVAVGIDATAKKFTLSYIDENGASKVSNATFAFGLNSLTLSTPLTYLTTTIKELFYDATTKQYYVNVNGTRSNVLNSLLPVLDLKALFGPLKDYSQIEYNSATIASGLSADFNTKFTAAKTGLFAIGSRVLDKVSTKFNTDNTMSLIYTYRNSANSTLLATITFTVAKDANGVYTFTFLSQDGNAGTAGPGVIAVTDYFRNNKFKVDWVTNPGSGPTYGGLFNVTDNTSFFYGTLIK